MRGPGSGWRDRIPGGAPYTTRMMTITMTMTRQDFMRLTASHGPKKARNQIQNERGIGGQLANIAMSIAVCQSCEFHNGDFQVVTARKATEHRTLTCLAFHFGYEYERMCQVQLCREMKSNFFRSH